MVKEANPEQRSKCQVGRHAVVHHCSQQRKYGQHDPLLLRSVQLVLPYDFVLEVEDQPLLYPVVGFFCAMEATSFGDAFRPGPPAENYMAML